MCQDETKEKLSIERSLLKLHLKYISGISFACICLVVVLSFCEDSTFKNCISVSSTVTSIILSAIAIILSVTGERTTNEIRNKVSDSVSQLEDCTAKSNELSENLSATLQQLEALYENVNDNIGKIPQIESTLNEYILKSKDVNEDDVITNINDFINIFDSQTRKAIKETYIYIKSKGQNNSFYMNDIMKHLIAKNVNEPVASLAIGLVLGTLCTGIKVERDVDKIIEQIK